MTLGLNNSIIEKIVVKLTQEKALMSCRFMAHIVILFILCFTSTVLLLGSSAWAKEEKSLDDMSLEELLNVKISVATKSGASTRTSPAIVTLITSEEMTHTGARDLLDVLTLVPGFFPASDVQNTVSFGIRGLWGHEGKILLMIDGIEMNEQMYATLQFGNHFPVQLIERVEIIRGPGSAIYGGNAELAVINVITKGAEDLNGIAVTGMYGQMTHGFGRRDLGFGLGKKFGDLSVSLLGFAGQGQRSDRDYTDTNGDSFSMNGNSNLYPLFFDLGLKYKTLEFRGLFDQFNNKTQDAWGTNSINAVDDNFGTQAFSIKYTYEASPSFSFTPEIIYRSMRPWTNLIPDDAIPTILFDRTVQRTEVKLSGVYDITDKFKFTLGAGIYADTAQDHIRTYANGEDHVSYVNKDIFTELLADFSIFQLTAGTRYDYHSQFGGAFVPRFGIVKAFEQAHVKALYSRAFRAPSIENIDLNANIKPETTSVLELEAGFQPTSNLFFTANLYDIRISDPIVYSSTGGVDSYANFDRTGTRGIEIEGRYKDTWGYITANYSFYTAVDNQVDYYTVPGHDELLLGFPATKVTLKNSTKLWGNDLRINPSIIYFSERYGFDVDGSTLTKYDPETMIDLNISKDNFLINGLRASIGVHNLLNNDFRFIQAYDGGHNPLPGASREFVLQLYFQQPL